MMMMIIMIVMMMMKGYKPLIGSGGVRKLCLSNATWTGGLGTCAPVPVTCPALSVPEHAAVSPETCSADAGSPVNSVCRIYCR